MTGDPSPGEPYPPMPWKVRLAVAYLNLLRRAVARGILPPRWAERLTAWFR